MNRLKILSHINSFGPAGKARGKGKAQGRSNSINKKTPSVGAKAADIVATAAAGLTWFMKLHMPLLSSADRLALVLAGLLGIPQFIRAYNKILLRNPNLAAALNLTAEQVAEYGQIYAQLVRIAARGQQLGAHADSARRVTLNLLKQNNDALVLAGQKIVNDPSLSQDQRQAAQDFLDFVDGYRQKQRDTQSNRQARTRKKTAQAQAQAAQDTAGAWVAQSRTALPPGNPQIPLLPAAATATGKKSRKKTTGTGTGTGTTATGTGTTVGTTGTGSPPPKKKSPAPSNPAGEAIAIEGAPLDECLEAPVSEFVACADDLLKRDTALGCPDLTAVELAGLDRPDSLMEGDLAVLIMDMLPGIAFLFTAAGVSSDDMSEQCDVYLATGELDRSSGVLSQGARDGLLAIGSLALAVHQGAVAWVKRQPSDPKAPDAALLQLGLEIDNAYDVLLRSQSRSAASARGANDQVAAIGEQAQGTVAQASYEDTLARVNAGEQVDPQTLAAALLHKDQLLSQARQQVVQAQSELAARTGARKSKR